MRDRAGRSEGAGEAGQACFRPRWRIRAAAAACVVLLLQGCASGALTGTHRPGAAVPAERGGVYAVVPFPDRLGELTRGAVEDFETRRPGLGISVAYGGSDAFGTIYVYDKQRDDIPDDIAAEIVTAEIAASGTEIFLLERMGHYRNVRFIDRIAVDPPAGSPRFVGAKFGVVRNDGPFDSYLFLTTYKGYFVKVRYTAPSAPGEGSGGDTGARAFVLALAEALRAGASASPPAPATRGGAMIPVGFGGPPSGR